MPKILTIKRNQLAEFIKDHKTIIEFEKLFTQDNEYNLIIENILESLGIGTEGIYLPRSGSNYLDGSEDMYSDSTLLDNAIFDYTREYVIKTTVSTALSAVAQTVICDATSGDVNITLPPPADCFESSRSFRIAVHKTDTSSNKVAILPNASELVVGEESQTLKRDGEIYNFITDGTNWYLGA